MEAGKAILSWCAEVRAKDEPTDEDLYKIGSYPTSCRC